MEIILLEERHAKEYLALRLEALKNTPEAFGSSYEEEKDSPLNTVGERLSSKDSFNYGAFSNERLIGTITLVPHRLKKLQHKADLFAMYVTPEYRGRGIGKALVKTAIEKARTLDYVEQLNLSVVSENEAAKELYFSLGFELFGLEKKALKLGKIYLDEFHMKLEL